jgi:type II secretion system protein N
MSKALTILGYSAWTIGCVLVFAWLLFPYNVLRGKVLTEVNEGLSPNELRVGAVRPGLFPIAFKVHGIEYLAASKSARSMTRVRPDDQEEGAAPKPDLRTLLSLDRAKVRARLIPLLRKGFDGRFRIKLYDGVFRGRARYVGSERALNAVVRGLDLSKLELKGEPPSSDAPPAWEAKLKGEAELDADLRVDLDRLNESDGSLELRLDGFEFEQVEVRGFSLPQALFNDAVIRLEIENGRAVVKQGQAISDVVEVELSGHVVLNRRLERSRLNLKVKFKLRDDLQQMVKLAVRRTNHLDEDGWYNYRASGTLAKPKMRADDVKRRGGARQAERARGPSEAVERGVAVDPGTKSMDSDALERAEERRQELLEKRQQQRDERRKRFEELRAKRLETQQGDKMEAVPVAPPEPEVLEDMDDEFGGEDIPPGDLEMPEDDLPAGEGEDITPME